jgi:pimeloyl-ACP methyl ester carboxylesterase
MNRQSAVRQILLFMGIALSLQLGAHGEERLVRVGARRLSINCSGQPPRNASIILMPGGGEPSKNWAKVQVDVATFAYVCSYDPAGSGASDKTDEPQSADEVVNDLHGLLEAAGERKPYILVANSLAGIFARRFATRFPNEVAAFVFVDSSHEEQSWRLHEIDPGGPPLSDKFARMGFFITPGERLGWRTELPLIVLARGKPFPRTGQLTEEQFRKWDKIWDAMQHDLATHSPKGEYRRATDSGHLIDLDAPELIVQAIRDVMLSSLGVSERGISTTLEPAKEGQLLGQGSELKQQPSKVDADRLTQGKLILQRAQRAMGGIERLAAAKDITHTMDITLEPIAGGFKIKQVSLYVAPDQTRQEQEMPSGKVIVYTDGKSGWLATPQGVETMSADMWDQAKGVLFRQLSTLILSDRDPSRRVNAVDENMVEISAADGQIVRIEFDPVTGLPSRQVYNEQGPKGPRQRAETFSDWRDVGGIKMPYKAVQHENGAKLLEVSVSEYRINSGTIASELGKRP